MAERVEVTRTALPSARGFAGEHQVARLLRTGAVLAGTCFLLSLVVELVAVGRAAAEVQAQLVHGLRRAGVILLILTPVVRLVAAGVMLGLRGEWRYSAYGALVLLMLGVAVMLGLSA